MIEPKETKIMPREKWIKQAAIFYYQIFSTDYDNQFLNEILKGGGGNSILCSSWMKISNNFINYMLELAEKLL